MRHATGPLLTVDVGERTATGTSIDDRLERTVGGRALATELAHDRIPFDADPFGPENRLYLSTGPLQGSTTSFTGRMNLTGLSPLTDGLASANAGGYLSRNFVAAGLCALELVGESDELLGVHVTGEAHDAGPSDDRSAGRLQVAFETVPDLAGATVPEVSAHLRAHHDLGPEHCIAIGPAGENRVRFASVMTYESRAFGRGGLGAVLGAKNVKFVTFDGDVDPGLEFPDRPTTEIHREAATSTHPMRSQGTASGTEFINDNFSLPTRYFDEYAFEDVEAIGGNAVEEKKYKNGACSACAYACKLPTRDEERGVETEGPEFETIYAFGSMQDVGDIVDVMQGNELCDTLGMDTISAGVTVAAYLASEDEFGNADLAQEITERIAYREGIGDRLAEGVDRCHDDLGVENLTVKGLEFAAHDGRVLHGQGLSYAVANRGADHLYASMLRLEYSGELDPQGTLGKATRLVEAENAAAFLDSGIVCVFGRDHVTPDRLGTLFGADYEDLLAVGERTVELERYFNNRRGFDRTDDRLPYEIPDLEAAIDEYYEARGWNDDGTVPAAALESTSAED